MLKFTDLAGNHISLFINYAGHCVVINDDNYEATGDLAGLTSRYIEQYYQGKFVTQGDSGWDLRLRPHERVNGEGPVAVLTRGTAGDQNPYEWPTM